MNSPIVSNHDEGPPPNLASSGIAPKAGPTPPTPLIPSADSASPSADGASPSADGASPAPKAKSRVIAKRYRVDEILGEGGMAVVYRGWHLPLDEPIAIKILKQEYAENEEAVTRFLQEARAGALLRGKNVAQVLDIGRLESGPPFMVTELLQGHDLEELLEARGRLPVSTMLRVAKDICSAVAEIHQSGIVHRDLKPANIFVTREANGEPLIKLLDFGIAKRLDGRDIHETKNSLGSPHYMAPEQIMSAEAVDVRADIWSLGILFFELLTGGVPFDSATVPAQCAQVLNAPCPNPSDLNPAIPASLSAVILRCLEKNPDARYSSALELRQALEACEESAQDLVGPADTDTNTDLAVPITVCLPASQTFDAAEPTETVGTDKVPSAADRSASLEPAAMVAATTRPRRRGPRVVAAVLLGCAGILAFSLSFTRNAAERAYGATEAAAERTYSNASRALSPRWERWFPEAAPVPVTPGRSPRAVDAEVAPPPTEPEVFPAVPEPRAAVPEPRAAVPTQRAAAPAPAMRRVAPRPAPAFKPQRSSSTPVRAPAPRVPHPDTAIEQRYALTPSGPAPKSDLIHPYPDLPLK